MINAEGRERAEILGEYVIETGATVRSCAAHFGISKSTVHKDITQTLKKVNKTLYYEAKSILAQNKEQKTLKRGNLNEKFCGKI